MALIGRHRVVEPQEKGAGVWSSYRAYSFDHLIVFTSPTPEGIWKAIDICHQTHVSANWHDEHVTVPSNCFRENATMPPK